MVVSRKACPHGSFTNHFHSWSPVADKVDHSRSFQILRQEEHVAEELALPRLHLLIVDDVGCTQGSRMVDEEGARVGTKQLLLGARLQAAEAAFDHVQVLLDVRARKCQRLLLVLVDVESKVPYSARETYSMHFLHLTILRLRKELTLPLVYLDSPRS